MTDNCDCNNCCNLYNDINENDNQYIIDRLNDIIKISEFLIKTLEHKKEKEDLFNKLIEESKEEEKNTNTEIDDLLAGIYREILKQSSKNPTYVPIRKAGYPHPWSSTWF